MSENTKWTPVPWESRAPVTLPGIEAPAHVVKVTVTPADRRTQFVAVCNGVSLPNVDNARLIAAAPELYEALEAVLVMWDRGPSPRKLEEALSWRENDERARALAAAALAKARGDLPKPPDGGAEPTTNKAKPRGVVVQASREE